VNLEQELHAVAIDWPPTPELAAAVERRLSGEAPQPSRRRTWRLAAVAVAVLAVALGAVLAVSPGARSAVLELFRIKGATVQRVQELPDVRGGEHLDLGERVSLEEAERVAGFDVLLPEGADVDEVWFDRRIGRGAVTVVWCCPRVVLTQFRGLASPYAQKQVGPDSEVDYVPVNGRQGIWISGAQHVVVFRNEFGVIQERPRLARNVLLWEQGPLTLRLEGGFTKARALEIARSMR
jgi:hypothetical protein